MPNAKSTTATAVSNETQQISLFAMLAIAFYLFSEPVFAQSVMGRVLCSAYGLIIYDIGRGLATLAIVALGVGAMLGRVTWGQAVTVCAGIGAIFGAMAFASALAPFSLIGKASGVICEASALVAAIDSFTSAFTSMYTVR